MAITLDAVLGSNTGLTTGFTGTVSITTSAAAAAGARVVVCYSWFETTTAAASCTIGGVAATQDKRVDNGSDHFAVFSRVVAAGLASSSTITCSLTAPSSPGGGLACAVSYLGTTSVDTTASNTTTGTGFSSGSATNALADALFVGGAGNEAVATTVGGTNTNGTSRADIYNSSAGQGMRMLDKIASSTGAQALTGTWASTSTATTGALVIYSGTAAAAVTLPPPQRSPLGV